MTYLNGVNAEVETAIRLTWPRVCCERAGVADPQFPANKLISMEK
jgi:hypothetical protein